MAGTFDTLDETRLTLEELAAAITAHEREHARLAIAAARLEHTGDYTHDGTLSMTAWLRHHCRMTHTDAGALLRRGRFLTTFTPVATAALDTTLSAGHIRALQHSVTRSTEHIFHEHAAAQVDNIAPLSIRDAEHVCAVWRQHAEAISEQPVPSTPERSLTTTRTGDGTLIGRFVFDPALTAQFEHALRTAGTWEGGRRGPRSPGRRRRRPSSHPARRVDCCDVEPLGA
jgi:hypothetical protein